MSHKFVIAGGAFSVLAVHPLFEEAQELAVAARPRRRRYFGPPMEDLNPHYAYAGRNEQPTLQECVDRMPPEGGLLAYLADLDRAAVTMCRLSDREIALRARWFE